MPELSSSLVLQVLQWDGSEDSASSWATLNAGLIEEELQSEDGGIVGEAFNALIELAGSELDAAAWGLADFFGNIRARELAGFAVHRVFTFVSVGARHVRRIFQPFTVLLHRYSDRLFALARRLRATGFSIGVTIPLGFSFALNFDFVGPTKADPILQAAIEKALKDGRPALERLKRGVSRNVPETALSARPHK